MVSEIIDYEEAFI